MEEPRLSYHSYLLRLWQAEQNGEKVWRGALDCVQNGKRVYFQSLVELPETIFQIIEPAPSKTKGAEIES